MKPCNVCDETGWVDDPPRTWASEPNEHRCIACGGSGELEDDQPDNLTESDWLELRAWDDATDKWLDELEYPN